MKRATYWAIVATFTARIALAHEQSLHRGHPTEGWVTSVSDQGLVIETEKGNLSVTLQDTTRIERGDRPVARTEIRKGDQVSVFGTKLESGELVAKEIIVHGSDHGGGGHQEEHQGR